MPPSLTKATTAWAFSSSPLGRRNWSDSGVPTGEGWAERTKAPPCERFSMKSASSSWSVAYAMVAPATGEAGEAGAPLTAPATTLTGARMA